ncbi:hypothetical protein QDR37_05300 [Amnibacterium sp. CER49]|uniref:hypothetical protein n=1 Tax=Amnibacterium sp. CER49 TaxID=3039161 RepID=UPI00244B73CD|nr:hypothetical protein [Amnibacterium sp. CER49]MDH2443357.1 hypothetical protein [Amnibacterium sp. CER49]
MARRAFPLDVGTEAFAPFLGEWLTAGSHGMLPGVALHGRASIDRLEPAGFLRMRSSIAEDVGIPEGVAVLGTDGDSGRAVLLHHDQRGVTRIYEAAVDGRVLRWWRDAPGFAQRYTLTAAPDGRTMTGAGELCRDGSTWERDLDLVYTRLEV